MLNFDKQNEYVFIYKIYGGGNNILKGYFDYVNTSNFEIKDFPTEQRHISQLNVVSRGNDYFFSYINVEKKPNQSNILGLTNGINNKPFGVMIGNPGVILNGGYTDYPLILNKGENGYQLEMIQRNGEKYDLKVKMLNDKPIKFFYRFEENNTLFEIGEFNSAFEIKVSIVDRERDFHHFNHLHIICEEENKLLLSWKWDRTK